MAQTDGCLPASCNSALLSRQSHPPAPARGHGADCSHGTSSEQQEHCRGPRLCPCLTRGKYPGYMFCDAL